MSQQIKRTILRFGLQLEGRGKCAVTLLSACVGKESSFSNFSQGRSGVQTGIV